jgi:hypothetical protein
MYLSVLLCGVTDLAMLRVPSLPPGLDGLALVCAFLSQGFTLAFHLSGAELDVRIHLLLVIATWGAAAAIAVALLCPASRLAGFVRCVAMLSLGSFYMEAGDLLYARPAFDSHEGATLAPNIFILHYGAWGCFVFCLLLLAARMGIGGGAAIAVVHAHADEDARAADEEAGAVMCSALAAGLPCRPAPSACAAKAQE